MNNKIILVDDNAWEHVAAKLRGMFALNGLDLVAFSSVDDYHTHRTTTEGRCPADLFIIDVMMPPGEKYKNFETHDGLITGLYVARDIRSCYPLVPIILWSATNLKTVHLLSIHMERKLNKCIFVKKPLPPEKLVELVESYLKHGKFTTSLAKRVWDGIVVRPSIGGLGVDVKKLLDSGS